jgi:hypothetical protein
VLAIGSFSLLVAVLDFARRRKVCSALESGAPRMSRSSSSSPQAPAEPYVGAAQASTVAERQSIRSIEGLARLPHTPSLPFGGFLPVPLPSSRDRVVRFATSPGAIAFRRSGA